jgi:hypothetical protein
MDPREARSKETMRTREREGGVRRGRKEAERRGGKGPTSKPLCGMTESWDGRGMMERRWTRRRKEEERGRE